METKKFLTKVIIIIGFFSLLTLFFTRGRQQPEIFKKSRVLMGTVVNITVIDRDMKKASRAADCAFKELQRIEKMFSSQDKSGEIYKLNQSEELKFFKTTPEVIFLLEESRKISDMSQGAFDVSVGPLVELWKGKLKKDEIPSEAEIQKKLSLVNYKNIEIDSRRNRIRLKKKGIKIDLGAIAKGYAIDRAVKILKENGIENSLVEAGGDLFASGKGKNKKNWRIGVRNPRGSDLIFEFKCANQGVATSGDYERFKILNKKRFHHLIDPRTGLSESKVASVTIIAPDAMEADALATAVFILGEKKGISLIKKTKDLEGIVITEKDKGFKIFVSKKLKKSLVRKKIKNFL